MTTGTMPILDARSRGEAPKRTPPEKPRTLSSEHSGLFSPVPNNLPNDPVVRWSWIFGTAIKAALPLYLLIAILAILAL